MDFSFTEQPHTRLNILTGEKVLVSPHRSKRPWQGQVEDLTTDQRPAYDPACYLCPGNKRADGTVNAQYEDSFRSEEHTSELQSRENLVCRLLLEKKKKI